MLKKIVKIILFTFWAFAASLFFLFGIDLLFDCFPFDLLSNIGELPVFLGGLLLIWLSISIFFWIDDILENKDIGNISNVPTAIYYVFLSRRAYLLFILISIIITLYITVWYIKPNVEEVSFNKQGITVKITNGITRTQYYLFPNSYWSKTDVQLKEGDKIKVNVTGTVSTGYSWNDANTKFEKIAEINSGIIKNYLSKSDSGAIYCDNFESWKMFYNNIREISSLLEKNSLIDDIQKLDAFNKKEGGCDLLNDQRQNLVDVFFENSSDEDLGELSLVKWLAQQKNDIKLLETNTKIFIRAIYPPKRNPIECKDDNGWESVYWDFINNIGNVDRSNFEPIITNFSSFNNEEVGCKLRSLEMLENKLFNKIDRIETDGPKETLFSWIKSQAEVHNYFENPDREKPWPFTGPEGLNDRQYENLKKIKMYQKNYRTDDGLVVRNVPHNVIIGAVMSGDYRPSSDIVWENDGKNVQRNYIKIDKEKMAFTSPNEGQLWLVVNDSDNYRADNGGFFLIKIEIDNKK